MKRFAFLVFVLTAGLVAAESKPFNFNMGVDTEYLSLFNDLETDVGGVLNDSRATMGFMGGHVFADISRYVTVSAGVWYGLLDANVANDGVVTGKAAVANSMLLLDVSAVLKYPISVGESFSFAPKFGLDAMYYLLGNFDGASPSTTQKTAVSPFSFIMGADADYTFSNGVFLRLPIDVTWALNSRPASISGSYVASHTLTLRTGIAVGYKLAGFEPIIPPEAPQAQTAGPATEPTAEPKAEPEAEAPIRPAIRLAAGGGASSLTLLTDQTYSLLGTDVSLNQLLGAGGVYGFFDVSDYFSGYVGFLVGIGDVTTTISGIPGDSPANKMVFMEIGAEFKYPLVISDKFSVAPKLGFADVLYLTGKVGSDTPNSSGKQGYSPLLVTAGADLNFGLDDHLFVRVPIDIGYALNTKLSDSAYSPGEYGSSYSISFRTGLSMGYNF